MIRCSSGSLRLTFDFVSKIRAYRGVTRPIFLSRCIVLEILEAGILQALWISA
tara:strand:+ start:2060 stop:2218 length:159 start_codon:yes stop_codon:yes gene_type:complete